jgi:hypothetical protein
MQYVHVAVAMTFLVIDLFVVSLCPLVGLVFLPSLFGCACWVRGALDAIA